MSQLELNLIAFIRAKLMKKNCSQEDRQDAVEATELFIFLRKESKK